ncbi:MAG: hypothetical protein ACFE89_10530 [Candidatus Hodarchaeota archaeon]
MTETKVAAFFRSPIREQPKAQWVWESKKGKLGFTPESDLVAAVTYLRMQSRSSLRLSYISKLYLPIYLIRVNPEHSLIVCGVGNSSITLKNITVLPPEALENLLSHVEQTQQVPSLVVNLEKLVRNLHPTSITLPKPMKPSMLDPIRRLIEPSLPPPSKKRCIEPAFGKIDAQDLESNLREEITRLTLCHKHLMHMMDTINKYIERQLNYINEERLKIHQSTAAELDMSQLLNHLEGILKFATHQCRQFILQMDSSPTKTDLIFRDNPEDLIQPQILAHDFRQSLQQTSIELDVASSQLEEVERRWLSLYEQEKIGHQQDMLVSSVPEYRSLHSPRKSVGVQAQSQLSILVSLRERILGSYPTLIQTLHDISSKLEEQYNRCLDISAKTNDFLGEHLFVEVLIPIFIIKTLDPTRYAIIPPLRFQQPPSPIHWKGTKNVPPVKAFNVQLFDDQFCLTLQEHLRLEMVSKPRFRESLDKQATRNNELKHKRRVDRFLQGVQELSLRGLMSTRLADDLAQFWLQIK